MKHLPFSVFRRAGRRFYSVKFKNESGEYLSAISTGQETESAAIATAFQWLKDGIPKKNGAVSLSAISLRDAFRNTDVAPEDCEYLCGELQRLGLLESYTLAKSRAAVPFADFLLTFWDFDNSPYIQEKLRKSHGIHRNYTEGQLLTVQKTWAPFFKGRILGDIGRADIERFIDSLGKKLSAGRKNSIIRAGLIPLRWAHAKDMIGRDITKGIVMFSGKIKERQILTPELAAAIFRVPWNDDRARLANMLAMVTGMRAGEIQGLQVKDLGRDCLYIKHSWNCRDGLKTTKNNENRTVEVFPEIIGELLSIAKVNPHGVGMESYVFWGERKADKPMEEALFIAGLRKALQSTGMGQEAAKEYCFHGWRHTYSTYMKGRIDTRLLKSQTGHKTDSMLFHYSDHGQGNDRETIQAAQRAAFGGLLPYTERAASLYGNGGLG
jgi:integrase